MGLIRAQKNPSACQKGKSPNTLFSMPKRAEDPSSEKHSGARTGPLRSRKGLLLALYVLAIVALFVNPFVRCAFIETWDTIEPDWAIFYPAAQKLAAGELPYPPEWGEKKPREPLGKGWKDYIYPPTFARLLIPLTYLGPFWSMKAYLLICFSAYCLLLFPRYVKRPYGWVDQGIALGFFFGWGPVIQDFRHGQTDFIPLFLFALSWKLLRKTDHPVMGRTDRRKEVLAGLLLGFSFAIKLTPILILPVLVVTKRWRIAAGSVVGAVALLVLTGPFVSYHYFTRVLPTMLADFTGMRDRPVFHLGIVNLVERLPGLSSQPGEWNPVASGIGVVVSGMVLAGILILLWRWRNRIPTANLILLGCFLPPLFAGDLNHHYALALLPAIVVARRLVVEWIRGPRDGCDRGLWMACFLGPRLRLVFLLVALIPSFYYWDLTEHLCYLLDNAIGMSLNIQLLFGNFIALLLVFPILVNRPATREKLNQIS